MPFAQNKYFKFFASIRFAIPVLFLFAAAMSYGTFCESLYGTEYVRKGVYHTWWFYLIQAGIAVSVIFAVLARIPFKKRLTGFYVIHAGLVTIMVGSVVTRLWGIDGVIEVRKGYPQSSVRLNDDLLYVSDGKRQNQYKLPETVRKTHIDQPISLPDQVRATLLEYLPYAKAKQLWKPKSGGWTSEWQLKNDRVTQVVPLANHAASPTLTQQNLGPLHLEVVSPAYFRTLKNALPKTQKNILFANSKTGMALLIQPTRNGAKFREGGFEFTAKEVTNPKLRMTFYDIQISGRHLIFFPKFSKFPITKHMSVDESSEFTLTDTEALRARATVFVAHDDADEIQIAMGKGTDWTFKTIPSSRQQFEVALPWMGFQMKLLSEMKDVTAEFAFEPATPQKEEEKNFKALKVRLERAGITEDFWVTNRAAVQSNVIPMEWYLGVSEITLPFEMTLNRFKMDLVPGTDKPASYESFVSVQGKGVQHIYMNHPLKTDGFTFYQNSYQQDESGEYFSILSVNRDPGRAVKYGGALLLILGMTLHFGIIYGRIKV